MTDRKIKHPKRKLEKATPTKLLKAVLACSCSHCFFLLQRAYDQRGLLSWNEIVTMLKKIIRENHDH